MQMSIGTLHRAKLATSRTFVAFRHTLKNRVVVLLPQAGG